MFKTLLALAFSVTLFSAQAATVFGEVVDKAAVMPVEQLLAAPQKHLQQVVTISGTVDSVCSKQGCWMKFAANSDNNPFRIKVRDGEMVFPLSAKGKTAYATGVVTLWPQSEDKADGYQLVPTAVEIAD
ncbi:MULTISPECIES: DUF4920 domain-containing protein [unclassified Arsukibacterium]|uniref:DUF4920 domain-containing protein n=1 Tax=unclassified Arsukibacterium TaxID=2635278 RepID=UPI000C5B677E|nr:MULTISPECIES: DUF4920 domain-containing protein [unclassified Arsukibacterium]MAA94640.1 hypothetical protein [Rheinheimera sp.]MBM32776.1 hypothetical protein [Rheinheimera sp.]HAW93402.1 DUF4920 domain-containing protein [Candidatus Azambacteria bacterium]|tara:strand:- start:23949 stop:24335 length:387 start_codon:yes stop_codon:yes gene_type:complete